MTKQEIKDLCEDDDKLQWWAMVLFAELSEYHDAIQLQCDGHWEPADYKQMTQQLKHKVDEFPKLVIQRQLEKAKEAREAAQAERKSIK